MKIDSNDKVQPSPLPPSNKPTSATTGATAFADILNKSMGTESSRQIAAPASINPVLPPLMTPSTGEIYRSTEHMLDAIEQYRQLLSDAGVNMRGVGVAVSNLKEKISSLEPLVDRMPEGNPVKAIARETLMTAAKEVARYDGGVYV